MSKADGYRNRYEQKPAFQARRKPNTSNLFFTINPLFGGSPNIAFFLRGS
jgi:hypothetical protein